MSVRTRILRTAPLWAVLALALSAWVHVTRESPQRATHDAPVAPAVMRAASGVRLPLPKEWRLLEAGVEGTATWATPDGEHVVTVAASEYGAASLDAVTRAVRAELLRDPTVRSRGAPTALRVDPAPRADSATLLRFDVRRGTRREPPVHVAQVWRRDTRAGQDLVATWTSVDGAWPVDPRTAVPASDVR